MLYISRGLGLHIISAMASLRTFLWTISVASAAVASSSDNLKSCLQYALTDSGRVAFSGDFIYQSTAVNAYNLNIPITPAAVTFPTSSQQVSAIVKCAADNGYHVQPKSGGHSYGNYGMRTMQFYEVSALSKAKAHYFESSQGSVELTVPLSSI